MTSLAVRIGNLRESALVVWNDPARRKFLKKSLIWTAVAYVFFSALVSSIGAKYRVGIDLMDVRCLPWRVYLVKLEPVRDPKVGEYVAFVPRHGLMGPKFEGQLVGKMIAGIPGDVLTVKDDFASVSGRPIGRLDLLEKLNAKPGAFDRTVSIPEGKVLVVGTQPRSYDGRYWGFVDQSALIGRVTPIY